MASVKRWHIDIILHCITLAMALAFVLAGIGIGNLQSKIEVGGFLNPLSLQHSCRYGPLIKINM
jgi:hypothetical protein